jgi:hypothetical integral membrane protein (TIGR02206 family)
MQHFEAWSLEHSLVIAATVAATLGVGGWRRRLGEGRAGVALDRGFAAVAGAAWLIFNGWQLATREGRLAQVLPLHLSDLLLLAVAVGACTRWRAVQSVVYFWGLSLAPLAFLLPDLDAGPAHMQFWIFWVGHLLIMTGIGYEVIGRGYRPAWSDWLVAAGLGLAYVAVLVPLNAVTGFSYGYLGPDRPGQPALLARLGDWPGRILWMVGAALGVMAMLALPWQLARRVRPSRG